ncbi:unnamed protein product, partial [Phaeothamnion confervicola]
IVAGLLGLGLLAPVAAQESGPLTVRIMKSDGSVGIENVLVKAARRRRLSLDHETTTDDRGYCRFDTLPSGTYHLFFSKSGYRTEDRYVRISKGESGTIMYVRL